MLNPFETETIKLYEPITVGEHFVDTLSFRAPVAKDIIFAGTRYPEATIPFTACMISSLTGEPENVIEKLVPEDWANAVVIADRSYQRFCGHINLFDIKDKPENPTMAGTPPGSLPRTSAESAGN
jgi:hypothetical protein